MRRVGLDDLRRGGLPHIISFAEPLSEDALLNCVQTQVHVELVIDDVGTLKANISAFSLCCL